MRRFGHGLVVGRFHPLHDGHEQLIDEAARRAARVTVALLTDDSDEIPGHQRAAWLRERRPDVHVVEVPALDDEVDLASVALTTGARVPVDVLVGGSVDDRDLAQRLRVAFIELGPARRHVAVSSDVVHAAPGRHWSLLSAPVRAWYAQRIVVIGAEASGATRLSLALADALSCARVVDVGTEVSESRGRPMWWAPEDFRTAAELQDAAEEAGARNTPNPWLVCASDRFAVHCWHLRWLGHLPDGPLAPLRDVPPPRLYVLTAPDFAVPDGGPLGGALPRTEMHALFKQQLLGQEEPWIEVRGSVSARLAQVFDRLPELRIPSLSGIDPERIERASGRPDDDPPEVSRRA